MTQLATGPFSPDWLRLSDQLARVGQKYRIGRFCRGLLWWTAIAAVATLSAAAVAHFAGAGGWSRVTLLGWIAVLAISAVQLVLRPLFNRPNQAMIARLIEARVDGLHDGLTNALRLAERHDLASNPWLPEIYAEVARAAEARPLTSAVRLGELRALLIRILLALAACAVLAAVFRMPLSHGWQQLLAPSAFVPKVGSARIVSVHPGDIQVVFGKSMELTVVAEAPRSLPQPPMNIIFAAERDEPGNPVPLPKDAEVLPASMDDVPGDGKAVRLRYVCRLDRIDRSFRYRVEVAGTQSQWFTAGVIRDVRLTALALSVTPPAYLREPTKLVRLTAAETATSSIAVPEGSLVEVTADIDHPVDGAVLQSTGDGGVVDRPVTMKRSAEGRQFSAALTVVRESSLSILLTDAVGQAIFQAPAEPLRISVVRDAPPTIEMRWPRQDVTIAPNAAIHVSATVRDDRGLKRGRILLAVDSPAAIRPAGAADSMAAVADVIFPVNATRGEIAKTIDLPPAARVHGAVLRVQVEAVEDRDLGPAAQEEWSRLRGGDASILIGPQTTRSPICQIRLEDPSAASQQAAERTDALRKRLLEMLRTQRTLHTQTQAARVFPPAIADGQQALRDTMRHTADTFPFGREEAIVQKSLRMLAIGPAGEAIDAARRLLSEPASAARPVLSAELQSRQRRIIDTLETLLGLLARQAGPATQPAEKRAGDLTSAAEAMKKLDEALKEFIRQQQKILDQTAPLARKPVESFDAADKKRLDELARAQEKLDAFMQEAANDYSRLADQDLVNSTLRQELFEIYVEVTMAKDALKQQAMTVAVEAEQNAVELAKSIQTNGERWLPNVPDRTKWLQEDPPNSPRMPMANLAPELEDLLGELLEHEEDLFAELEDGAANWHSSSDRGIGWNALDGPITNMTARGVSGNQLPSNNEMSGRSGEGRSGRSQGEFVEETASGKGGRRTPTRLDPSPFQKGQVKDQSKDPTGGATGGGKVAGQGGEGLEGSVPAQQREQMQRLAQKQAQLRNTAERLQIQHQLGRYDNFRLLESIALMRRIEADLAANRYQTALRRKEMLLDRLDTSRLLVGAEVHVRQDTTPTPTNKERRQIGDAMKGELPPAWKDALKGYYERLSREE